MAMKQLPEIIFIDGVLHTLYTMPLLPWLREPDNTVEFDQRAPDCERGYIGKWKIENDTLWLDGLYAWRDGEYTGLIDLFGTREKVPADWFSGPLIVEPASSEILDGAMPRVKILVVKTGRIVEIEEDPATPKH